MSDQTYLPFGIPPKKYPTVSMIATLKRHKRYKKGMEHDEAASIIQSIAESHEPLGPINLIQAMAKFQREKRMMEEKMRHVKREY